MLLVMTAAGLTQAWYLQRNSLPAHWLCLGYDNLEYFKQYVWAYSLLNLTSAAFIFCAMENVAVMRLLSFRPLVSIGVISYGVYVWHLPLLRIFGMFWVAAPHSLMGLVRFSVYLAASIGTAALSYVCYERYFLKIKNRSSASPKSPLMSGEEVSTGMNTEAS
jgi:peptidoglycan/LPS O-acetylase OafA/YrhL